MVTLLGQGYVGVSVRRQVRLGTYSQGPYTFRGGDQDRRAQISRNTRQTTPKPQEQVGVPGPMRKWRQKVVAQDSGELILSTYIGQTLCYIL